MGFRQYLLLYLRQRFLLCKPFVSVHSYFIDHLLKLVFVDLFLNQIIRKEQQKREHMVESEDIEPISQHIDHFVGDLHLPNLLEFVAGTPDVVVHLQGVPIGMIELRYGYKYLVEGVVVLFL